MLCTKDRFKGGLYCTLIILVILLLPMTNGASAQGAIKKYTVTTKSIPSETYRNYSTYNQYTRYYYVFKEILSECESNGGGTITVKKGTYTIPKVLCISSNVTLILEDGVVIKKGNKTGTDKLSPSKSIFQFIKPSKLKSDGYYKKYKGEKNIKIIGKGNATFDLQNIEGAIALVLGHNQKVSITGIAFKNMNTGHFIEMDASKNVSITNCSFLESIESPKHNKEAINLDTPDKETGGFNNDWSSYDKTPNMNITIDQCIFKNIDCAVGTHQYSQAQDAGGNYTVNLYHTDVKITNSKFYGIRSYVFHAMNWKNVKITNCEISGGFYTRKEEPTTLYNTVLRLRGVDNLTFKNNTCSHIGYIAKASYITTNSSYSPLYSNVEFKLSADNIRNLIFNNSYKDVKNSIISTDALKLGSIVSNPSYEKYIRYSIVDTKNDRIAVYVGLNYKTYTEIKADQKNN